MAGERGSDLRLLAAMVGSAAIVARGMEKGAAVVARGMEKGAATLVNGFKPAADKAAAAATTVANVATRPFGWHFVPLRTCVAGCSALLWCPELIPGPGPRCSGC